jgi:hypothetical protein
MADERLSATTIIDASPEVVFAVLADPAKHAAIDGTGWVCEPLESDSLTAAGQVFRMGCTTRTIRTGTTRSPTKSRSSIRQALSPGRLARRLTTAACGWGAGFGATT